MERHYSVETRSKKKKNWTEKKVAGKSLDNRDGDLKQEKQGKRRKLWTGKLEGDLSFTLSIFLPIVNEDKYTGWQTSHPPLYVLLKIKKTRKCVAGPLLLPVSKKISGKVCRNAAYTSYCVTANSSKIEKTRWEGSDLAPLRIGLRYRARKNNSFSCNLASCRIIQKNNLFLFSNL